MLMNMNASTKSSPLETIIQLARVRAELVRDIDRSSGHGMSFSDLVLVRVVAASPDGRIRRTDLAHALGVTPSAVARQVGPLERMGILARESNPKDARLALVVLTEAGKLVEQEASVIAEERASAILERTWSADERASLTALLARAHPR
jgi:DNA-binding MarR family transcriptional regulator